MKKPQLIITADWHLRETTPLCRTDDYLTTQWNKVDFIKQLQLDLKCPVFHAGDMFDFWKPSPSLLSETIKHLPAQFYTVYGNHDLPQHSFTLRNKSGIYTLAQAGVLTDVEEGSWNYVNTELTPNENANTPGMWFYMSNVLKKIVGVQHIFLYEGDKPWATCESDSALSYMKKNNAIDLFLTGDNHTTFVVKRKHQLLVNPGSLLRITSAQKEHKPCVFVYYNDHTVEQVYLPIEKDVITTDHITVKKDKQQRVEAFISRLKEDSMNTVSFEDNLKMFFNTNKIRQPIKEIIYNVLEEE